MHAPAPTIPPTRCAPIQTACLGWFLMELVGLDPATSWVRSSHANAPNRMVRPFESDLPTRPNTFRNSLRRRSRGARR